MLRLEVDVDKLVRCLVELVEQVHHLNRAIGGDVQMPLAFPVSKTTGQPACARLELLCADGASPPSQAT